MEPLRLTRWDNAKQVLGKVLADRCQMFGRIASKKQSRPLSDQLIAFKFAVKLLDDLGVEFRMKSGHHGITVPQLPGTIVLSFDPACPGKSTSDAPQKPGSGRELSDSRFDCCFGARGGAASRVHEGRPCSVSKLEPDTTRGT